MWLSSPSSQGHLKHAGNQNPPPHAAFLPARELGERPVPWIGAAKPGLRTWVKKDGISKYHPGQHGNWECGMPAWMWWKGMVAPCVRLQLTSTREPFNQGNNCRGTMHQAAAWEKRLGERLRDQPRRGTAMGCYFAAAACSIQGSEASTTAPTNAPLIPRARSKRFQPFAPCSAWATRDLPAEPGDSPTCEPASGSFECPPPCCVSHPEGAECRGAEPARRCRAPGSREAGLARAGVSFTSEADRCPVGRDSDHEPPTIAVWSWLTPKAQGGGDMVLGCLEQRLVTQAAFCCCSSLATCCLPASPTSCSPAAPAFWLLSPVCLGYSHGTGGLKDGGLPCCRLPEPGCWTRCSAAEGSPVPAVCGPFGQWPGSAVTPSSLPKRVLFWVMTFGAVGTGRPCQACDFPELLVCGVTSPEPAWHVRAAGAGPGSAGQHCSRHVSHPAAFSPCLSPAPAAGSASLAPCTAHPADPAPLGHAVQHPGQHQQRLGAARALRGPGGSDPAGP